MATGIKEKLENPVIASLATLTLVAGSLTAFGTLTGSYDASHTNAAELAVVSEQVDAIKVQSKCATLDIKIALVEEQIFQMEMSGTSSKRLVEKRRNLRTMEKQYDDLHCASLLK